MSQPENPHDAMDHDAWEAEQREGIDAWVAEHFGGTVTGVERVERWRPQWKVEYTDAGGAEKRVFVRGHRPISGKHALRFEMEVMQALEANGIKVPHIYGWIDSPKAFAMDWIETEDRAPGMVHTAMEAAAELGPDRWQAMLGYMDELAKIHALPVEKFTHIRGLSVPDNPRDLALTQTERMYRYGQQTNNIDAPLAFLQSWLRRNVPEHRNEPRLVTGDAGQFMSHGPEVVALMDFEIAAIADTHWDLACFRGRHPLENMGDIPALYRRYGEATGVPVDLRAVGYHTVNFLQLSSIAAMTFMAPEIRGANWIEGVLEYASITRRALEAAAELHGVELDYGFSLPDPVTQPWEESGLRKLLVDIDRLPTSSAFAPWEKGLLHAIPEFLLNHARYRGWFEQETTAEASEFAGRRFASFAEAEAGLMAIIEQGDPARDDALIRLLHRRLVRFSMIVAGTNWNDENPLFYVLDPILE